MSESFSHNHSISDNVLSLDVPYFLQSCQSHYFFYISGTVNLEIVAAKIFSVSRIIDILANISFSDLVLGNFSSNFIIMLGSSLLVVLCICLFYFLVSSRG